MKKVIIIEGMTCGHCVKRVENALREINGIEKVEIILDQEKAIIEGSDSVDDEKIIFEIDDAGYKVVTISNM